MSALTSTIPPAFHEIGWQASAQVFLVLAIIGLLLTVGSIVLAWLYDEMWYILTFLGACLLLIGGCIDLGYLVIAGPEYMKTYRVTGTITDITDRLDTGTGDLTYSGEPVVTLDTVDVPLRVDDPRVLRLEGRTVTLTCITGWNYRAQPDFYCKIYDFGSN